IWQIMDQARPLGIQVRTVPRMFELLDYQVGADTLREVRIEDLLSRDPVPPSLSMDDLTRAYGGKRILVTGAGGSIGSELCRQLVRMGPAVLLLAERDETNLFELDRELRQDRLDDICETLLVDVCDAKAMAEVFRQ